MNIKKRYQEQLSDNTSLLRRFQVVLVLLVIISISLAVVGYKAIKMSKINNELQSELKVVKRYNSQLKNDMDLLQGKFNLYKEQQNAINWNKVYNEINKSFYIDSIPLALDKQQYIHKVCNQYDIDYELVLKLISLESNLDVDAINTSNSNGTIDRGVGQINSANKEWLERELGRELDLMNFYDNIDSTLFILNHYRDNNIYKWVTQYNRGITGTRKYYKKHLTYKSDYAILLLSQDIGNKEED